MIVDEVLPGIAPGFIVQLPAGNPLNTTEPEGTAQVGWVIVPITGAAGGELIVIVNVAVVAHWPPSGVNV